MSLLFKLGGVLVTKLTFKAAVENEAGPVCGYEAQVGSEVVKLEGALQDENGKVTYPLASLPLVEGDNSVAVRTVTMSGLRSVYSAPIVIAAEKEVVLPNPPTLLSAE